MSVTTNCDLRKMLIRLIVMEHLKLFVSRINIPKVLFDSPRVLVRRLIPLKRRLFEPRKLPIFGRNLFSFT